MDSKKTGKASGKASGKGKTTRKGKTASAAARAVGKRLASSKAKSVAQTSIAAMVSVGPCRNVKSVVTAQQLAVALGVDGKRLRGWLRRDDVLKNDGRYSHYGIDANSKDGRALVKRACGQFKADYDATMGRLVKVLAS